MELRLNDQEKELVLEILEERHKNLIHEIGRTDHRDFKHELQTRCSVIEGILSKECRHRKRFQPSAAAHRHALRGESALFCAHIRDSAFRESRWDDIQGIQVALLLSALELVPAVLSATVSNIE